MARGFRSITVKQLRDLLEDEDDATLVAFACDFGDHSHTQQAIALKGEADTTFLQESAYSDSGFALPHPDDDSGREDGPEVLVIT